ncbi:MAG: hypothetical protein KA152_06845 [Verrucomicrobiales bacterium]|nr:hypothetical protein [Verrucomicrobiales bacterium]
MKTIHTLTIGDRKDIPPSISKPANRAAKAKHHGYYTGLVSWEGMKKFEVIESVYAHYFNEKTGSVVSDSTARKHWKPHYKRTPMKCIVAIPWDEYCLHIAKTALK